MKRFAYGVWILVVVAMLTLASVGGVVLSQESRLLDDTPRLAVISAFDSELQLLLAEAEIDEVHTLYGVSYHVGRLRGNDVVMFLSGVSMVNAAMTTERALNNFNVDRILFSGIAGGVNPELNIGDVVIPVQYGQYLEAYFAREIEGEFMPPVWWTPEFPNYGMMFPSSVSVIDLEAEAPNTYQEQFWFPVDEEMYEVASSLDVDLDQCTADGVCLSVDPVLVVGGNGVSGQAFVDNAEFREFTFNTFGANVLEMETAAIAQVAASHGIPYLAVRSLSDLAGGGEGENEIGTFFQLASDNSAKVLLAFLEAWSEM